MAKKAAKKTPAGKPSKDPKPSKAPAKKAAKKKATDKPAKAQAVSIEVQRELDHLHQIQQMNVTVQRYAEQYEADKAEAAISKKALDYAAASLSELIKNGPPKPDPQKKLPFDAQAEGEVVVVDNDAWKKVPIREALHLSDKDLDKLSEYGIKTVGEFEFVRGRGDRQLPDGLLSMKGVGEAKVTKWEAEMIEWQTEYFKAHPQIEPGDKKKKVAPPDKSEPVDDKQVNPSPPAEWQLMALEQVTKLSKKHIAKLAEQGVATLGTLHLIMTGKADQFPKRLESLDLPANTIKALDVDIRGLFGEMGVKTDEFESK